MIDILQWPNLWVSAYEPNIFAFRMGDHKGSYVITSVGGLARITAGAGVVNFGLANYISFFNGTQVVVGQVTQIVGSEVRTDIPLTAGLSSRPVYVLFEQPMKIRIETARLSLGESFTTFGMFYAIYRDGKYTFDVQGYIQKAFQNIGVPPNISEGETNDKELYIQYRLTLLYDGAEFELKGVLNSAYSTLVNPPVTTALRVGPMETFNGSQSMFSQIVGNKIITVLA